MNIQEQCAERIVHSYFTLKNNVLIIYDKAHMDLSYMIKNIYDNNERNIMCLMIDTKESVEQALNQCKNHNIETLVLIESNTFSKYQIYRWLDFSHGAPKVAGINADSYVSVFPIDSAYRVYGSNYLGDRNAKALLLTSLKENTDYKITTANGTRLFFTSRKWLDEGNEVLTAPIEETINGVIAVDGALFFRSINTIIDFYIEYGKLKKIETRDIKDDNLIKQYNQMTNSDFEISKNRQLAEIGIGCNTNAIISDCFMESEMKFGTCHFCFGNNECYGGKNKSDFHGASILIREPHFEEC